MPAEKAHAVPASSPVEAHDLSQERRRWPRYAITAMARVIEPRSMAKVEGRCTDLGAGGCYVDSINSLPMGSTVQISISQGHRRFQSQGRVIFSLPGMGMGLMFTEMEPHDQAILQAWVHELSCGMESEPGEAEPAPMALSYVPSPTGASTERTVLMHLIDLLARRHQITAREAEALLRELLR